jgi:hypothetical protein
MENSTKRQVDHRITRYRIIDTTLRILLPILVLSPVWGYILFQVTNVPVSRQIIEGRFLYWTVGQKDRGQPMPRVFVDLPEGRTTAVVAWADWRPPETGSAIRIEQQSLRWYGTRYRLVP